MVIRRSRASVGSGVEVVRRAARQTFRREHRERAALGPRRTLGVIETAELRFSLPRRACLRAIRSLGARPEVGRHATHHTGRAVGRVVTAELVGALAVGLARRADPIAGARAAAAKVAIFARRLPIARHASCRAPGRARRARGARRARRRISRRRRRAPRLAVASHASENGERRGGGAEHDPRGGLRERETGTHVPSLRDSIEIGSAS